jgi:hypothetical protein
MNTLDTAEHAIEKGLSVLLNEEGGKRPIRRFKGTPPMTREELRRLYRKGMNISIRLGGLVALDADDEEARDRLHQLPDTPLTQESPRGEHRVYRLPSGLILNCRQRIAGVGLDLKSGANSFLMLSPSQVGGKPYRLLGDIVRPEELPEFDTAWLPQERKPRPPPISLVRDRTVEWARRVLHEEYYSIEGCGGDTGLFKAACFLIQRACLDHRTALHLLLEWNADGIHAIPSWPEARIRYKLDQAVKLMK